jgi:hypothetical protein
MCSPGPNGFESVAAACHSRWVGPQSGTFDVVDLDSCAQRVIRKMGVGLDLNLPGEPFFDSMPEGSTCEAKCHYDLDENGIQTTYENSNTVRTFECKDGAGDCLCFPPSRVNFLYGTRISISTGY